MRPLFEFLVQHSEELPNQERRFKRKESDSISSPFKFIKNTYSDGHVEFDFYIRRDKYDIFQSEMSKFSLDNNTLWYQFNNYKNYVNSKQDYLVISYNATDNTVTVEPSTKKGTRNYILYDEKRFDSFHQYSSIDWIDWINFSNLKEGVKFIEYH